MTSNLIAPNNEQCIEFYYYQNNSLNQIGELNLYTKFKDQDISSLGFPVWSSPSSNDFSLGWKIVQVPVSRGIIDRAFQAVFEQFVPGTKPGNCLFR